jgi:hypothetical protein
MGAYEMRWSNYSVVPGLMRGGAFRHLVIEVVPTSLGNRDKWFERNGRWPVAPSEQGKRRRP